MKLHNYHTHLHRGRFAEAKDLLKHKSRASMKNKHIDMKRDFEMSIAKDILRVRFSQMIINEEYKEGRYKIPIHNALGHEAIAVAVGTVMQKEDKLVLNHRNIHYNLAKSKSLKAEMDEYLLKKDGLAKGRLGSMNLANEQEGVAYTSSILGNNLSVAAGLALGQKVNRSKGLVIVITGDGAIEEGAFYESLVFLKSNQLSSLVIVENNGWSLATMIQERRCNINLKKFTASLNIKYEKLQGNDVYKYIERIQHLRMHALNDTTPVCIEVQLRTLGYWILKNDEHPDGKFINYHSGPAPTVNLAEGPIIEKSGKDPVFVLERYFSKKVLSEIAGEVLGKLKKNIK